jgi:HEAT repeat protein
MKTVLIALLVTGAAAAATGTSITSLSSETRFTLTAIDQVPTKTQLDNAFASDPQGPLQALANIATDSDTSNDAIGIRLRAIHALAKYCGTSTTACAASDLAHQSVATVIAENRTATEGSVVLVLRAAIETLGTMRVASDVTTLRPLLDHPSRDIRAATARALRDLCNAQAITDLRARYTVETTDQVKLAISEALRILGQCSANL